MKALFKISEFSRLSRIPLQTLRYYDQLGILKPGMTDESTGYRYYFAEQLLEINRIVIYKELGFTLQQIALLLHEDISTEQIRGMLRLKESEIERQLDMERSRLVRVKERMQLLEREGKVNNKQEVVLKRIEAMHMITYASQGIVEDIPNLFEMFDGLHDGRAKSLLYGPQTLLWNVSGSKEHVFEFEAGYAVKSDTFKLPEHLQYRFLPSETMATLLFRSDSAYSESACLDLAEWIEQHGYLVRSDQPGRETYVPLSGEPGVCLIEIQLPIECEEERA